MEKQNILRIRENRVVKRSSGSLLGSYLQDKKDFKAWYNLREYLRQVKGWKGQYWLPIDERFAMPVSPYSELTFDKIKDLTDQDKVADEAFNFTRTQTHAEQHKTRYYDFLGIAAMGAVVAVIIIAIMAMKGKINLGALFGGG